MDLELKRLLQICAVQNIVHRRIHRRPKVTKGWVATPTEDMTAAAIAALALTGDRVCALEVDTVEIN